MAACLPVFMYRSTYECRHPHLHLCMSAFFILTVVEIYSALAFESGLWGGPGLRSSSRAPWLLCYCYHLALIYSMFGLSAV